MPVAAALVIALALGGTSAGCGRRSAGTTAPPGAAGAAEVSVTFSDLRGIQADLARRSGRAVLVNFWATWCGPCFQEHPVLVENSRMLGDQVQFLGVVFDDTNEKINAFLNARGSSYPTLVDEKGKTAIAYGVGGVPETFFLDRNGKIVAKYEGPMSSELLQSYIVKAMKQ